MSNPQNIQYFRTFFYLPVTNFLMGKHGRKAPSSRFYPRICINFIGEKVLLIEKNLLFLEKLCNFSQKNVKVIATRCQSFWVTLTIKRGKFPFFGIKLMFSLARLPFFREKPSSFWKKPSSFCLLLKPF